LPASWRPWLKSSGRNAAGGDADKQAMALQKAKGGSMDALAFLDLIFSV